MFVCSLRKTGPVRMPGYVEKLLQGLCEQVCRDYSGAASESFLNVFLSRKSTISGSHHCGSSCSKQNRP